MGDDDDAVHPEEGAAAVGFVVGAMFDGAEGPAREEIAGHAEEVAFELDLQPLGHGFGGGFATLEDDVSGEAVAEADIEAGLEELVALDVAEPLEGGAAGVGQFLELLPADLSPAHPPCSEHRRGPSFHTPLARGQRPPAIPISHGQLHP